MLPRKKGLQVQHSRNQKLTKPAERPIVTPGYTRRHFEELNHNIVIFTQISQSNNNSSGGRELSRDEIYQQWTRLIQGIFPADDPKRYELLSQVKSPMYDGYWEKRADEKAFLEREHRFELCAFNKPRRNPTQAQNRNWPGCILMEDIERKEILVPRISLLALQQVNYLDFVKSILQANPSRIISRFTMEELWVAVVTKIFHFENALAKELKIGETKECTPTVYRALVADYQNAYEAAKARVDAKRAPRNIIKREREDTADEEENDGDAEHVAEDEEQGNRDKGDRTEKRHKKQSAGDQAEVIGQEKDTTAQHLGPEQQEVGPFHFDEASWQDIGQE